MFMAKKNLLNNTQFTFMKIYITHLLDYLLWIEKVLFCLTWIHFVKLAFLHGCQMYIASKAGCMSQLIQDSLNSTHKGDSPFNITAYLQEEIDILYFRVVDQSFTYPYSSERIFINCNMSDVVGVREESWCHKNKDKMT